MNHYCNAKHKSRTISALGQCPKIWKLVQYFISSGVYTFVVCHVRNVPISGWTRLLRALVSVAVNDAGTEGQGRDQGGAGKAVGRRQGSQGSTILWGTHHGPYCLDLERVECRLHFFDLFSYSSDKTQPADIGHRVREGRDQGDVAPRLQETFFAEGALEVLRLQEGLLHVHARVGDRGNA